MGIPFGFYQGIEFFQGTGFSGCGMQPIFQAFAQVGQSGKILWFHRSEFT